MRSRKWSPARQVSTAAERAATALRVKVDTAGFGPVFVGVTRVPGIVVLGLHPRPVNHDERFDALEAYLRELGLEPVRMTKHVAGIDVQLLGVGLGPSLLS